MSINRRVPNLPTLKQGECYMRLVETAQRCDYPADYGVHTDLTWYFQSLKKLGRGDYMFISGNWILMNEIAPAYIDNNKTVVDLWIEAMGRGAKIAMFSAYYYLGDLSDCDNGRRGLDTGMLKGYTGYGSVCQGCGTDATNSSTCIYVCCQIKKLKDSAYGSNFINLISDSPIGSPSSHVKHITFLYKSSNTFSIFFGAWNPVVQDWPLKETGFGMVGNLSDDIGKYLAYFDYKFLEMLKMQVREDLRAPFDEARSVVAGIAPVVTDLTKVPSAPVNIPVLFVYGPDSCDPNYGCDIGDKYGNNNQPNCQRGQRAKFSNTVDTGVKFTISVAPSVTHYDNSQRGNCVAAGFADWGWGGPDDKQIKDATTVIVDFINNSREYVKMAIMSQFLGNPPAPSDDYYTCGGADYTVKLIADALVDKATAGVPLFAMCSDGDYGGNGGDRCQMGGDLPLGWKLACNPDTNSNFYVKNYGYGGTHDKFWVNEDSFILSSGHPNTGFHMTLAYNYWNLFQNCPNLISYMNNHWNYMWTHCADYNFGRTGNQNLKQLMQGKPYSDNLGNKACPSTDQNQNGCCRTGKEILKIKDYTRADYYGSPYLDELRAQIPPPDPCQGVVCGDHGSCQNGACVCRDGYTGSKCQTAPSDPCQGVVCGDHGTCSGGKCVCADGYTGSKCQNPPVVPPSDPCYGVNCGDHGTCKNGACVCRDGYSGDNCNMAPVTEPTSLTPVYVGLGLFLIAYILLIFLLNKRK